MNINSFSIPAKHPLVFKISNALFTAYLFLTLWLVPKYFTWDFNVYLGLMVAPYICRLEKNQVSLKYMLPALIAVGLAILLPVKTMLFIAILFSVLLLIENSKGRINHGVLFLMLLISPVFNHLTRLVELPVRLWISKQVAQLLTAIGIKASSVGNLITMNKNEFFVDPACAGLNMLTTSLLTCLFVVTFYQRKTNKALPFFMLSALLIATLALNVICNFFRVILLVLFKVMPESFFHDFIGMFCLILYVMVPLMYASKLIFKHLISKPVIFEKPKPTSTNKKSRFPVLHLLLFTSIILISFHITTINSLNAKPAEIIIKGYNKKNLQDGIMKFESPDAMVYLKPTAFYAPEHDPMVCWTGSGYHFMNIKIETISGKRVYTATLLKGNDKLYSAWWFDNGIIKTINQFKWRWSAAHGAAQFYLINVNASSTQNLRNKTAQLLNKSI